jgi:hypothetical protein
MLSLPASQHVPGAFPTAVRLLLYPARTLPKRRLEIGGRLPASGGRTVSSLLRRPPPASAHHRPDCLKNSVKIRDDASKLKKAGRSGRI